MIGERLLSTIIELGVYEAASKKQDKHARMLPHLSTRARPPPPRSPNPHPPIPNRRDKSDVKTPAGSTRALSARNSSNRGYIAAKVFASRNASFPR